MEYTVYPIKRQPELRGLWVGPAWRHVPFLEVAYFCPESSAHRPVTQCKLLYDADRLYGLFKVDDHYVRSVHTGFQADVYKDSCVEFFVQPKGGAGYFNFEFSCGGAWLASYVTDPTREEGRVRKCAPLSADEGREMLVYHTMPEIVEPEIAKRVVWRLEFAIPLAILEKYAGPIGELGGQMWRANFYKCGSETSHPHWAAWSPIGERNFHAPSSFGRLRFER